MTIISKAALAAELSVSKARVSQYLKAGLPERDDGKIDREAALHWISQNLRSGADHRKGPARARALVPPAPSRERQLRSDEVRRVKAEVVKDAVYGTMSIACDLGLPMRVVFALTINMQRYGADIVGHDTDIDYFDSEAIIRDWQSIAEGQGEKLDLDGWEAYRAEMYDEAV